MTEHPESRAAPPRWRARVVTTLGAWMAAYLVVFALLSALGDELGSLPLAVRALVISGVVVILMTTLVMPALSVAVGRWLAKSAQAARGKSGSEPTRRRAREPAGRRPRLR